MTPDQLRQIRGDRTREEFAAWLGGTTASTLNKWERSINPIPPWVAEKCLANVQVSLPLKELQALMDHARQRDLSFESMLGEALRNYLRQHTTQAVSEDEKSLKPQYCPRAQEHDRSE